PSSSPSYPSRHHLSLPSFPTRRSSDLYCRRLGDYLPPRDGRAVSPDDPPDGGRGLCDARLRWRWAARPVPRERHVSGWPAAGERSEEHTSELQSRVDLVCRLLLEKKKL